MLEKISSSTEKIISLYEICKILGKEHNKAMKIVTELCNTDGFGTVEKKATVYNSKGQTIDTYYFTHKQALIVGGRLDNKNLIKIVDKLEELANKVKKYQDSYLIEDPIKRAEAWIIEAKERKALELAKEEAEAKRDILIHQSKRYTASELAGELGFKSAMAFNKKLNKDKIQYKVGGTWKLYAKYESLGYADYKQVELDNGTIIYQMRWTGIGRDFLLNMYK